MSSRQTSTGEDEDAFELGMFADTAARIAERADAAVKGGHDPRALAEFDRAAWRELGEGGLLGLRFPLAFGGSELGAGALAAVATGIAHVAPGLPFLGSIVLFGEVLAALGNDEQKAEWLPRIASGEAIGSLAGPPWFEDRRVSVDAVSSGDGITLTGRYAMVPGGSQADVLVVCAREADGGMAAFLVERSAAGVQCTPLATLDGLAAADLTFDGVRVTEAARLSASDVAAALQRAYALATALVSHEAASIARTLCKKTLEHCRTRVAFDKPLVAQQVIAHGIVDMQVATALLDAGARRAIDACDRADGFPPAVHAAKFLVGRDGAFVGKRAVHFHGAIGTTEELESGRLFRRMTTLCQILGGRDVHLHRYAATMHERRDEDAVAEVLGDLTPAEAAFRNDVRGFYAEKLTPELRRAGLLVRWAFSEFDAGRQWQRTLHERGWGAPHWPVEFGGQDWSARQRIIFAVETMRAGAPTPMSMGRDLCAPCIMQFGTAEQKSEFIPRILDGTDWWAQGYSESQAGSDLAALSMKAERDGDAYILNGSKIWTTYAHHANRIFCLVRTMRGARKQEGISFMLVDMDTPGIEVRPIINLAGDHDFNEVFFDNVRVPATRLLGTEHDGWKVARHLLKYEHGGRVTVPMQMRRWFERVLELAQGGQADNPVFSARLAETSIDIDTIQAISWAAAASAQSGAPPSEFAELVNIRVREVNQTLTELMLDAAGPEAMAHRAELLDVGSSLQYDDATIFSAMLAPLYYNQRAATIAGGTPEIHRNNLARPFLPRTA